MQLALSALKGASKSLWKCGSLSTPQSFWECNPNTFLFPPLSPRSSRSRCPAVIAWAWGSGGVTMGRRSGMNGLWPSLHAPLFTTPPGVRTPSACRKTPTLTSTRTQGYTDLFLLVWFFQTKLFDFKYLVSRAQPHSRRSFISVMFIRMKIKTALMRDPLKQCAIVLVLFLSSNTWYFSNKKWSLEYWTHI